MGKEYVPIFFDWTEVTGELNAQEKGRLIDAIVLYASGGNWQEQIKGNERYLFPAFRKQIDRANELSSVRATAGKAGVMQREANRSKQEQTAANGSKTMQTEANGSKTPNNKEKEEEKENQNKESFNPPTVAQAAAFIMENGLHVDPESFVHFYGSVGWNVKGTPMTDWQEMIRTWHARGIRKMGPTGKAVSAQQYGQRSYTEEELLNVSDDLLEEARKQRGA